MLDVKIDGKPLKVFEGATILQAAAKAGIRIPTLCHLKQCDAIGSCRMCVVSVEGSKYPVAACSTKAKNGMVVTTSSPELDGYRRLALDLILSDHGIASIDECESCRSNGRCELQTLCRAYGVTKPSFPTKRTPIAPVDSNPFLSYDANLCIHCQRCVSACNRLACNHTLQTGKRGIRTIIDVPFGEGWKDTSCESCGNCAQACPTGALTMKRRLDYRAADVRQVLTTCPHCGVGCQMNLVVKDNKIVDAQAAPGPANKGMLCVKGRSASFDFVDSPERIRTPLIKNESTGEFEPATWDDALDLVARRFTELRDECGGDTIAAFASSRSTNEDIYLFQKMARVAFRTTNIDNCARV